MTPTEIIKCEKVRAAQVWHELCAAPIKAGWYEPIIQRHLLTARAEQIRELLPLIVGNLDRAELSELATALEAAAKGVK